MLCAKKPDNKPEYFQYPAPQFLDLMSMGIMEIGNTRDDCLSQLRNSDSADRKSLEAAEMLSIRYTGLIDKVGEPVKGLYSLRDKDKEKFEKLWILLEMEKN